MSTGCLKGKKNCGLKGKKNCGCVADNFRLITYQGVTKNMSAWARELGISRQRLFQRLVDRTTEEALNGSSKEWSR